MCSDILRNGETCTAHELHISLSRFGMIIIIVVVARWTLVRWPMAMFILLFICYGNRSGNSFGWKVIKRGNFIVGVRPNWVNDFFLTFTLRRVKSTSVVVDGTFRLNNIQNISTCGSTKERKNFQYSFRLLSNTCFVLIGNWNPFKIQSHTR